MILLDGAKEIIHESENLEKVAEEIIGSIIIYIWFFSEEKVLYISSDFNSKINSVRKRRYHK